MVTVLAEEYPNIAETTVRESDGAGEALPVYLQEIGRVSLLNAAGEVALAEAYEAGNLAYERLVDRGLFRLDELDQLLNAGPSKQEQLLRAVRLGSAEREEVEAELETVRRGREARRRLIEANLRLVVSVARRYMNRGMALGDLIQEGNIGLLRAVEKFDYRRGFKFSTYATWWIRQGITRALADHARTIRIPVHMVEMINRMVRTMGQLQQELGREPTAQEVADALETTAERVREMLALMPHPMSLDTPVGDEQDTQLGDFVPDENSTDMEDAAQRMMLRSTVQQVLSSLDSRERRVIELRYGLDGDRDRTLSEIGDELGVTRERIRQIEAKALRKLRHPTRARRLRAFAD